ncbi:MAG: glycoside hydrolase family 9 protein [Thermoflexales bacterium]|nr:glycoside hydrolase family 9 protein [Thermoflexales bacterium]
MWVLTDQEYFDAPGLSALVFHNSYLEGKQGGVELIQHGERVVTNCAVFLEPIPHQWSPLATAGPRQVDRASGVVDVPLAFAEHGLACTLRVWADGLALGLAVDLDKPLPPEWIGKVSLNLEIFPALYFGKGFCLGQTCGVFPRQANGPVLRAGGGLEPVPLAEGPRLVVAPEDPLRKIVIEQAHGSLALYDGRNGAQNGWFVVRGLLQAGATRDAAEWRITLNSLPGWRRAPVIAISQVGYHPDQAKRAVIELDPRTEQLEQAVLEQVGPEEPHVVLAAEPSRWGRFLRYEYAVFDFTQLRQPGLYRVRYGDQVTAPFRLSRDVYQRDVWQPALETFLPVQMCHVSVRDGHRIWHGACHLDDALQAPPNHVHFDGYRHGPDTVAEPMTHIAGLDRGGWHDAGDDDLAAGSQARTTYILALARELFGLDTDQTTLDRERRQVILHRPDGVPDVVQQVTHGVENLLTGYRIAGHSFCGIIAGSLDQYALVGDTASLTDNRVYDPSLAPDQVSGDRSGLRDDRWVFTSKDTALEYAVAAALAAASRVLRGWEEALASECLSTALKVWETEQARPPVEHHSAYVPRHPDQQAVRAAVELLLATGDERYRQHLRQAWPLIAEKVASLGWTAARAMPHMEAAFASQLRSALEAYRPELERELSGNPFGVPFHPRLWGGTWHIQEHALHHYFLHRAFPDLFDRELVLRALNYVLGCHPASDVSLVSGVGARSLIPAYGYNRADWGYIPGGGGSGPNVIWPDFPELKHPFPFLWQQSEYVIGGAASYLFCVLAADQLLNGEGS